jgi:hypothetical protein
MQTGSEIQTTSIILIFNWDLKSIYENSKSLFKEVYFWNKLKNRINHGFALTYNMQKK